VDFGGLGPDALRAEWSDALEQAAHLGVSLSDEERELALRHAGERGLVHANALSDTRDASLEPAREKARAEPPDREALQELLSHGGYRDVLEACRLAHKLPPEASGALFAQVARRVDPVALDALLTLLSFSEPLLVRAGAALALASRRALNALDDLAGHVAHEAEPEFQVFALALGRYGAGSFRAISRALQKHEVQAPRAELVYAHLALHGARAQVRAKARGREPHDAELAERALALASDLKDGKKPALVLEQQGPLTVFCEIFDRHCRDVVS
jgi:acyl-CoA thioesterase